MKKIIFSILIGCTLIIGYFAFFKETREYNAQTVTSNSLALEGEPSVNNANNASSHSQSSVADLNTETQKGLIDDKDLANLRAWDATRGSFSNAELDEYGRLSQNTLEELAKQGDLKAIQTLAVHEEISGNHERGMELWHLAAVHGSTKALTWLSSVYDGNYISSKKDSDAVEALAYLNAAAKRGDLFSKYRHIDAFYKSNNFNPTEEQLKIIDSRSNEILNDLQKKRTELGLPEFDNTPAPELQRIFDALNKK